MKIAVSAMGYDLESPFSPVFGRCPVYVIVDTETMSFQAVPNQAASAGGGAGIQAAQDVVNQGVKAIVTGNIGPNAYQVLASAGVPVYVFAGGTVRQAVEAYRAGQLSPVGAPTGPAHGGMGMMRGMGRGMGGRGVGRTPGVGPQAPGGMAGQGGYGFGGPPSPVQASPQPPAPAAGPSQQGEDVASLKAEVAELRARLAKRAERIEGQGSE